MDGWNRSKGWIESVLPAVALLSTLAEPTEPSLPAEPAVKEKDKYKDRRRIRRGGGRGWMDKDGAMEG